VIETIAGNGERRPPTDGAVARGASMLGPRALHVLDDTLWIALREGNSVWTLDLVGGRLRHVAGDGEAGYRDGPGAEARFSGPKGIVATAAGRVLVVDTENQVIREVDAATGTVRTVAGVGPQGRGFNGEGVAALRAHFDRPHGICVRGSLVFVGDTNNHRVRRFALPE
jgi:hypothetical protein